MSDIKSKILMIGNELSLADAMKAALVKEGYEVFHVLHPDESTKILNAHRIDVMLVDCMLPRISGVDFIEQLKKEYSSFKSKIVLMSGIYTEKSFIQEATKRTQAIAFIKKELPFDHGQVVELVKKATLTAPQNAPARKLLYQIFAKEKVTNREKRKLIESLEEVNGFDLPFVYSLLVETKSSGYLNIYEKNGAVSGISFASGAIVGVDVEDKATYLGELLIQGGYATPLDVQNAVKDKTNMRLGQKLIKGNLLSPHAFDLALAEQMNIRLSRTIVDQAIRINFASADVELSMPCIDSDQLLTYLHDWIVSKLNLNWLKSLYMMSAGNQIEKTQSYKLDHPALQMSMLRQMDGFLKEIEKGTTINKILANKQLNEAAVYKALHFLLTKGLIIFSDKIQFASPQEQMSAVQKVAVDFKGKTHFEILALLGISRSDEGKEADLLQEFLKVIGPEPEASQKDLHALWKSVKAQYEDSVARIGDTSIMKQMNEVNQKEDAEKKLKATQIIEEVKQLLQMSMYTKAFERLNEALRLSTPIPQLHVFLAWAKIGQIEPNKKIVNIKDIEFDLMQVPPEERYDAYYPFVTGLLQKVKGDFNSAKKSFDKALAADSAFMPAKKEISKLENQTKKKEDLLSMDLTKVVSGFFRKKA